MFTTPTHGVKFVPPVNSSTIRSLPNFHSLTRKGYGPFPVKPTSSITFFGTPPFYGPQESFVVFPDRPGFMFSPSYYLLQSLHCPGLPHPSISGNLPENENKTDFTPDLANNSIRILITRING